MVDSYIDGHDRLNVIGEIGLVSIWDSFDRLQALGLEGCIKRNEDCCR